MAEDEEKVLWATDGDEDDDAEAEEEEVSKPSPDRREDARELTAVPWNKTNRDLYVLVSEAG